MDILRSLILTHWHNYHPKMVAQFKRENRLETELETTAEQFSDLIYSLVIEQKMDYSAAWEIAIDQFFLPEEEDKQNQGLGTLLYNWS